MTAPIYTTSLHITVSPHFWLLLTYTPALKNHDLSNLKVGILSGESELGIFLIFFFFFKHRGVGRRFYDGSDR